MSRGRGVEANVQKPRSEVVNTHQNEVNGSEVQFNYAQGLVSNNYAETVQITELLLRLPQLHKAFQIHRKIGEGTFSSVYLGSLRKHRTLPDSQKRWFAIKHLVPTAHPSRIEHELRCLRDIGGKHNVIGVDLCLRHLDTVVFVMPYIPHRKFSEYVGEMDALELRDYMRALFEALQHVHSFGVIHRDVKPSNFLYDRENRRYLLVDFGLAQRIVPAPTTNGNKRPREGEEDLPNSKRVALDLRVAVSVPTANINNNNIQVQPPPNGGGAMVAAAAAMAAAGCWCSGRGTVCSHCGRLPAARAARAGTQGFRPPEVLLKVHRQDVSVDQWAAGVVLVSGLGARSGWLRAPDDARALAELAVLLGPRLTAAACRMGRRIVMSHSPAGLCLRRLVCRLRGAPPPPRDNVCTRCPTTKADCLCPDDTKAPTSFTPGVTVCGFPDSAFALAAALLEPDPSKRLSASQALDHPFLKDPL